jgi:hypothetical protein
MFIEARSVPMPLNCPLATSQWQKATTKFSSPAITNKFYRKDNLEEYVIASLTL